MFVRVVKFNNISYLKIVKSFRENGKVKQKVIANLGRLDSLVKNGVDKVVKKIEGYLGEKNDSDNNKVDINTLTEIERVNYGFVAYKKIWNYFDLDNILEDISSNKKIKYDIVNSVFSMVINKLLNPSSKLFHFNHKDQYFSLNEDMKLQYFYRTLDILEENKEEIELKLFQQNKSLFNLKLDVVFFDVTTYYFESQIEDNLKGYGFSKDGKINNVQITMGLLIDKDGKPIGYELYRGNTFDGNTLPEILEKLKTKFQIDKIIFVADKGLNSKINLKSLKDKGYDYIVSCRLKNLKKITQDDILDKKGYIEIKINENTKYQYKEIEYRNIIRIKNDNSDKYESFELKERIISTYSEERASKDKYDRMRMISKAEKLVKSNNKTSLENHKGFRRYVTQENNNSEKGDLILDVLRIKDEEKYDGFYAIQTSVTNISAIEIINNYHYLYKIEESFRILKSTMEVRPVYHWKENRIEGHFVMCFIAFLLERELEYRLNNNEITKNEDFSVNKIKEALNTMELTKINIENKEFYLKSKHQSLASKIFAILKLKQPVNLSTYDELKTLFF